MFEDDPKRNLIEDARVWISGVEVTSRLTSAVTITKVGRGSHNTVQFTLSNASDGFVLNERNLDSSLPLNERFYTGGSPAEHGESIKLAMFQYKNDETRNPIDEQTGERRWPLSVNSTILHSLDTIFVAERWPYSQQTLYYPAFKGYVETKTISENFVNGQSNITVTGFDIRALISRMRLQMNYVITNALAPVSFNSGATSNADTLNAFDPVVQEGIFSDLQNPSQWTTPVAGLSLKDTIEFLVTGTITETEEIQIPGYSSEIRDKILSTSREEVARRGVGRMKTGIVVSYPNGGGESANDVRILEEWHRLCLFGVPDQGDDLEVSDEAQDAVSADLPDEDADTLNLTLGQRLLFSTSSRPWTPEETERHGQGSTWDGPTAPHAMSLHFLLPSTGGGMNGVTSFTVDQGSDERRWQSRMSIIEDYLDNLDYHIAVTGAGDMVIEFPMYDFQPDRFGEFEEAFRVRHDGEGKSITFDDDRPNVPACMIMTAGYNPDVERIGQLEDAAVEEEFTSVLRVVLLAPVVASRIGMNIERTSLPFALDDVCRLRQFAVLRFQRKLAEANNLAVDLVYRPLLFPNRPLHESKRDRMGWISQVTSTVPPSRMHMGHATIGAVLKYVRKPVTLANGDIEYRLITGSKTLPLSYTGEGPAMNSSRGILISDTSPTDLDITADPCDGSTRGAPAVDYLSLDNAIGLVFDENAAQSCSKSADDLAADVRSLWERLQQLALDELRLRLELTCTFRDPVVDTNEPFDPDLHSIYPARAFDLVVYRWDFSAGTQEDYEAVGALGKSIGLQWGGDAPTFESAPTIADVQEKIFERVNFHLSNTSTRFKDGGSGTPYIYGGAFNKQDPSPKSIGVDCSGLIVDCYVYAGLMSRDTRPNSSQLAGIFPSTDNPRPGDILFVGKGRITHCVLIGEAGYPSVVGASGGTKDTTTLKKASDKNARVKTFSNYVPGIRPESEVQGFATPFDNLVSSIPFLNHFSLP